MLGVLRYLDYKKIVVRNDKVHMIFEHGVRIVIGKNQTRYLRQLQDIRIKETNVKENGHLCNFIWENKRDKQCLKYSKVTFYFKEAEKEEDREYIEVTLMGVWEKDMTIEIVGIPNIKSKP